MLVSKIILTTTPDLCRDMMQFVSYAETFSYVEDLKKFRPTMRLQAFIEYRESQGGRLSPMQEEKRKAVCRGWWRLVLWYVRLRRAAKKKVYHTDLLKAERMAGPCANYPNPVAVVRSATLRPQDIEEIKENRELEESIESDMTESDEEDLDDLYRRETAKYRSA